MESAAAGRWSNQSKNLQLSMHRHPESLQVGHAGGEEETSHPEVCAVCLATQLVGARPQIFLEVFDNFNIGAVVDLFGSVNMATACLVSEPPRPYLALLRNPAHVDAFAKAIDAFIMREIGNAGPPPSKFFVAELKDVAARLYPQQGSRGRGGLK